MGPTWSSVQDTPKTPSRGTSPNVGFSPLTPQYDAGTRMDPPVSLPSATGKSPAARPAADPDELPPAQRPGALGLRTPSPDSSPKANSGVVVLARITAPASRSRATTVASADGTRPANSGDPAAVHNPAVSMMSFTPTGTPSRARAVPSRHRLAERAACSRAEASSRVTIAPTAPSVSSMRARQASTASTGSKAPVP